MRITAGIDVGEYGALSLLREDGTLLHNMNFFSDWKALGLLLRNYKEGFDAQGHTLLVGLEHTKAIPGKGGNGLIAFGANFGGWKALLEFLEIPHLLVPPAKWQSRLLGRVPAGKSKEYAEAYIRRRFPGITLTKNRKKNEGLIDSLCIAVYIKENH